MKNSMLIMLVITAILWYVRFNNAERARANRVVDIRYNDSFSLDIDFYIKAV